MIVNRDQLTYGREFDVKQILYLSIVLVFRFTLSQVDSIVKQAASTEINEKSPIANESEQASQ
jgi:hypothetical protein